MENTEALMALLASQEAELQFTRFTHTTALEIGLRLIEKAKARSLAIAMDIRLSGQQLFHYSFDGTSPDNDRWLEMKRRTVEMFHHSSRYMGLRLEKSGLPIDQAFHLSGFDYTASGGCFPIIIREVGVVGTIGVSGLASHEDHDLIVEVLSEYLK